MLLRVAEVAKQLSCSVAAVYGLIESGRLNRADWVTTAVREFASQKSKSSITCDQRSEIPSHAHSRGNRCASNTSDSIDASSRTTQDMKSMRSFGSVDLFAFPTRS